MAHGGDVVGILEADGVAILTPLAARRIATRAKPHESSQANKGKNERQH